MAIKPYSIACSFCGKGPSDVLVLVAGPNQTAICDDCVGLCHDIVAERIAESAIWKRMRERNEVVISSAEAEQLAWMKTWATSAPAEEVRRGEG